MLTKKEQQILDTLEPTAERNNMEIVTVEVVGSKKSPTIRVYIDCEGGVGFDELSAAQEWVNQLIDALDPFPGAYMLEISSPGIDRPLRTLEHFARFEGEKAQINLARALDQDSRLKWTGKLAGTTAQEVLLEVDGTTVSIPYELIKKAHVIATIDFNA